MPSSKRSSSKSTEQRQPNSCRDLKGSDRNPQRTISELFATSKKPIGRPDSIEADGPSPGKRFKLSHLTSSNKSPPMALAPADMYSFPPSTLKPNGHINGFSAEPEVIDLTGSPRASDIKPSPTRRKPSITVRPTALKSQNGPKQLVVKNLRKTPQADPNHYYKQVWNQLDAALSAIFIDGHLPCSLEELYKGVESLCRQNYAPTVYKGLRDKCKHKVTTSVLGSLVQNTSTASPIDVLGAVVEAWSHWKAQLVSGLKLLQRKLLISSRPPFVPYSFTWTGPTFCGPRH